LWSLFFVALGLGYGSLVGLARMLQGAHFLSDVLWALGFVYLTALASFYLLRPHRS
jgi:membrane-associated PAP2 superfamily phosphatase